MQDLPVKQIFIFLKKRFICLSQISTLIRKNSFSDRYWESDGLKNEWKSLRAPNLRVMVDSF